MDNGIKLVRQNRLCDNLIFADGIGSSGKGMTSHILSCFDRVEKQSNHTPFDYISYIHWLGLMDKSAAITYLQTEADQQLYHMFMSRDVNFRWTDSTGVLRNAKRFQYFKRLFLAEGDSVLERISSERPILNEAPHDALRSSSLFFEAFNSLRIIYIVRDPYELIVDWHRRGFGSRIGKDPREFQFNIQLTDDRVVPMFFAGYPEFDYDGLEEFERLCIMIHFCLKTNLDGYNALASDSRNVFFSGFNYLVSKPHEFVRDLESWLGLKCDLKSLRRILRQEKVPRFVPQMNTFKEHVRENVRLDLLGGIIVEIDELFGEFQQLCGNRY